MEYILKGKIITLNKRKQIIKEGYVGIKDQKISFVTANPGNFPDDFRNLKPIDTGGVIYPGLIDLHNHLPYNFLSLWNITKKYDDRYQWARIKKYGQEISSPTKLLAYTNPVELIKYVETKALLGGITSIDGYAKFNKSYSAWLLRNIEEEPFGNQEPPIYQSVLRLKNEQEFINTGKKMDKGNAFIYHFAEGTSSKLIEEYNELEKYNLFRDKLIGIHCTALGPNEWEILGNNNVRLVWSPLSNMLLYGKTTDVINAKKNGTIISLGSDWSPTGSKNILWELKVADLVNKENLNNFFSHRDLVEMITLNPAKATNFDDKIGTIHPNLYADLVVFDNIKDDDPYLNLILATEKNLRLSIIDGRPRCGDLDLLKELGVEVFEEITIGDRKKGVDIIEPNHEHGEVTLTQSISALEETLKNPVASARKLFTKMRLLKAGEEPLHLILEEEQAFDEGSPKKLIPKSTFNSFMNANFETDDIQIRKQRLDPLTMYGDTDFFSILNNNPNIPRFLEKLKDYII
ncbi:MAG: amidohydrolase family protein [Nitrososphaerales archaeon]